MSATYPPITIYHVDAFTERLFAGNPAAVCLLTTWLADITLLQIAAENHLSETAFLLPYDKGYQIRWFTAVTEVELCGHATLAAAFVVLNYLQPHWQTVGFHSLSGLLTIQRQQDWLQMQLPILPAQPVTEPLITAILGQQPLELYKAKAYLAIVADEQQVRTIQLNTVAFKHLTANGIIVSAPGSKADFVSRYFSTRQPAIEDPVTGSAHCTLAPYWAKRLGKTQLFAQQLSARGGEILCELADNQLLLSGKAKLYAKGVLYL